MNKFSKNNEKITFYKKYLKIFKIENKDLSTHILFIKYDSINSIEYVKKELDYLIFFIILSFIFLIILFLGKASIIYQAVNFLILILITSIYLISKKEFIIIKTPSSKEILNYNKEIFETLQNKL